MLLAVITHIISFGIYISVKLSELFKPSPERIGFKVKAELGIEQQNKLSELIRPYTLFKLFKIGFATWPLFDKPVINRIKTVDSVADRACHTRVKILKALNYTLIALGHTLRIIIGSLFNFVYYIGKRHIFAFLCQSICVRFKSWWHIDPSPFLVILYIIPPAQRFGCRGFLNIF